MHIEFCNYFDLNLLKYINKMSRGNMKNSENKKNALPFLSLQKGGYNVERTVSLESYHYF